jgi:DNA-directed RNA polymerase specialized sigma24 family protein
MAPGEFEQFCEHWYPQMRRYLIWKMRSTSLGEEAVQDLFTELTKVRERLIPDVAHRYMWKAAYFRSKHFPKVHKAYEDGYKHEIPSTRSVESVVVDRMMTDYAFSVLTDQERDVLEAIIIDGNSIAETARMSGVPVWQVGYTHNNAIRKITAAAA